MLLFHPHGCLDSKIQLQPGRSKHWSLCLIHFRFTGSVSLEAILCPQMSMSQVTLGDLSS